MTRDEVIKALSLCRYDPDPGQECKQLVSCDICPYWSDETGCRMTDLFTDAIALLKQEPKRGKWEGWTATHWTGKYDDLGDPEYKPHVVYHCSLCGRRTVIREAFCPQCGAKMEEEDHDR